jgi:hypothetical protein
MKPPRPTDDPPCKGDSIAEGLCFDVLTLMHVLHFDCHSLFLVRPRLLSCRTRLTESKSKHSAAQLSNRDRKG